MIQNGTEFRCLIYGMTKLSLNVTECSYKQRQLEPSLNMIIPPNSSFSQNRLMSQECKISDWRVNYTRAITEGDEYPAMASCQRISLCYRLKTWRE